MQRLPEPLKALVDQLARLPGLGPKSALRAAMILLKWPEAEVRRHAEELQRGAGTANAEEDNFF